MVPNNVSNGTYITKAFQKYPKYQHTHEIENKKKFQQFQNFFTAFM